MRYTRKDAEAAFERLCKATGHRIASSYDDIGAWELDYASEYGGYTVNEIVNDAGGVNRPLGDQRRSAREFCDAVYFAERVLETHALAIL